jgi:iron complex outermembrane receptor protein
MRRQPRHPSTGIKPLMSAVLRALSICAPAALLDVPATLAQAVEPSVLAAGIPAQPLARALEAFARQTGLQLVYVSEVVHDQRAHSVPAGLGAPDALARMLEGTGLKFNYLTPRSIRILAAVTPPRAATTNASTGDELQEVIVTANRREENLQNVPMTIQVLTGATLVKLNATTFDDFVNYLPGVTAHGVGPGQNNIYVRGLATATGGIQSSGLNGPFPNVAVYLDEQSVQLPNRNLDIYAADLERIEILEGPQGTLFGAGAEAGVVRYITNKPKLNVTETKVNAGYATTAHGAQSSNLDATLNLPLIDDTLAVRGVIYNEKRGGYIDNIPATFARAPTDPGIHYFFHGKVPANSVVLNNFNVAAENINPVTYQGIRVESLYRFNEDWDALLAQSYQSIEADGVFTEMAANSLGESLPDLDVQLYNPSYDKDKFENTALTINGRVGPLKLVYTGSYFVRNVEQVHDYTQYARNLYADYYQCVVPGLTTAGPAQCFTPSSTWRDVERNTHQSHELRLSTSNENRIRGIGGLFYENYRIEEQVDWFYLTALPYFHPIGPPTGYYTLNGSSHLPNGAQVQFNSDPAVVFVPAPVTLNNPNVRPLGDGFFNDITRGYKQRAAYASIDLELVPTTLTLTAGTRYSRTETSEVGSTVGSSGCDSIHATAPNPCVNHSFFYNINSEHLDKTHSGFKSRANLSWKVADDAMLYYTWSQGFRAGGFNRAPLQAPFYSPLTAKGLENQVQAGRHGGWVASVDFAPDSLTNNELGWKTMWLDRRIQWNGALYQEDWNRTQLPVSDPGVIAFGETVNGGNYRVRGVETSGVARVATGLTIEVGAAWIHSELVKQATFRWRDGTPIDFTSLHTSTGKSASNPDGALGTPLAGAPPFQGNVRVRYEFAFNDYEAFAQISAVHQTHSLASTYRLSYDLQDHSIAYDLSAFTTYDAAVGVGKHAWLAQFYGENLFDTRAQLYANYSDWYKAITVNRPRTLGLRFSYKISGK